jgi:hypothetical protein
MNDAGKLRVISDSDTHNDRSSPHDFDFLIGSWDVHHKRLKNRLVNDMNWEGFRGRCNVASTLNGNGTFDENFIELPEGSYHAVTLRCFDERSGMWSIWWFDGRHPLQVERPLLGRFRDGLGAFFSDEEFNGRSIRVRFIWSDITATSARWQQAFSADGGTAWETNWTMDFQRIARRT